MATEEQIAVFDEYVSQLKEDLERIANELKIYGTLGGHYRYSMSLQKLIGQYDTISRKASVAQLTIVPTEFITLGMVRCLYGTISEFTDIIELDDRMEAMGCEVHRRYPRELGVGILSMKTSLEKMYGPFPPFPTRMQRIKDASMDGIMEINIDAGLGGRCLHKNRIQGWRSIYRGPRMRNGGSGKGYADTG